MQAQPAVLAFGAALVAEALASPAVQARSCSRSFAHATTTAPSAVTSLLTPSHLSPPFVPQAAQEFVQVAETETAFVQQLGWAALMASFAFSLSLVVWGRSGL